MVRKIALLSAFLFSLVILPCFFAAPVLAAVNSAGASGASNMSTSDTNFTFNLNTITNPNIKEDRWIDKGINYVIQRIISIAAQIIGGVSVLGFSIGGLMMLLSGGGDQLDKAKNMMKYSLYGLVFVLGAYLLVMTIQTLVTSIFINY